MRRGRCSMLIAAALLWGAAGAARAQADVHGPPPAPLGADADAEGAGDAPGEPAARPQESRPLGGDSAISPLRSRFTRSPEAARPEAGAPSLKAGEGWWKTAGALAIVIALIVACGAGVRGWARRSGGLLHAMGPGGRAPAGLLQVLGRYPIGRGQTLVLLKLDRRVLLVAQGAGVKGGGMRTLCEFTEPEEVASILMLTAEAEGRSLGARFREMVSTFEGSHAEAERVLAPVTVERPARGAAGSADAVGRLRSRLASLRDAAPEGSA